MTKECTCLFFFSLKSQVLLKYTKCGYEDLLSKWHPLSACPMLLPFSHFNLLLKNCSIKLRQTWQEWILERDNSNLCKYQGGMGSNGYHRLSWRSC